MTQENVIDISTAGFESRIIGRDNTHSLESHKNKGKEIEYKASIMRYRVLTSIALYALSRALQKYQDGICTWCNIDGKNEADGTNTSELIALDQSSAISKLKNTQVVSWH